MTILDLAVWKAMIDMNEDDDDSQRVKAKNSQRVKAKKVKMDTKAVRRERRVTSGADIVVKNVLPFLKLLE